eukprot:6188185-Pleurochrysis_carterae.AAC.4
MAAAHGHDGSSDRNDSRSCGSRRREALLRHSHPGMNTPLEVSTNASLAANFRTGINHAQLHSSSPATAGFNLQHATSTPSLSDLCSYTRIYPEYRTVTTWVVLLLYAPFGVVLLAVRLLITTIAAMLIALCPPPSTRFGDTIVSWVACCLFVLAGMRMHVDGDRDALVKAKLIVANHVSQASSHHPSCRLSPHLFF